ncbi:MAG TPA: ribonucleotide reductase N-terminal alpha domain-containing protein, partial [Ktedonobacteraceae bacterium]|nr:ribonucleotide reductase N-terminal alpha domain-containing protein [Ktedonobacteraceae bacterium]
MLEQQERPSSQDATSTMTQLEGIRQKVFMDRYSLKDSAGQPLEFHPEQTWARVARGIAAVETTEEKRAEWEKRFYDALADFQFVPGGRILAGAGTGHQVTFYNCFVVPSPEDSRQGILDNLKLMTEIMARGGGVGINLSTLRPRGSYIKTVNGTASGPCSWAQLYSVATGDVIQQGGSRRGALMLMLDDNHPDIEEFITVKREAGKIEHANLSVCVSDAFMQAVKDDSDWNLTWQSEVKKTVRARALWDLICTSAWESAEPGVVFIDRYNKESNTWYYENIRCVNPCVTGDTLIYTDRGLLPASELAELGTPITVVSHDSKGVSMRQASHVFLTGVKPVYRLQTTEGYTVRLTKDHKILTGKGWKAAEELIAGDKIMLL